MGSVEGTRAGRLVGIEGLRALAAGSVLVFHCWKFSQPGAAGAVGHGLRLGPATVLLQALSLGVTLFFVLSGFLLYRPFAAAIARGGPRPDLARYARHRALRILPAYWLVLLVSALVLQVALVRHGGHVAHRELADAGALLSAGFLVQDLRPATLLVGIPPAWSLAVEATFYALLPLVALAALALGRRSRGRRGRLLAAVAAPAALLALGVAGKLASVALAGAHGLTWSEAASGWQLVVDRGFAAHADVFACGMLVAVARVELEQGRLRMPAWWPRLSAYVLLLAGLPLALVGLALLHPYVWDSLTAVFAALLVARVVLPAERVRPSRLVALLASRPLVVAGLGSYAVFLWNYPLQIWLHAHGLVAPGAAGFLVNVLVLGTLCGLLSLLTYRLVEEPALRLRDASPAGWIARRRAAAT